ncbi:Hypothetical protein BN69_3559 [Methylocystis sp. SC2]|nr:Hypothetical protein BN69_3559 [Methylocystis sp. SC2]
MRLSRSGDSTPAERRKTSSGADLARFRGAREVAHSERKKNCGQRDRIKKIGARQRRGEKNRAAQVVN